MSDSTADVQQCCAVVLHEIERGVVFLRNSHNLSGDIAEICQRRAERLVQWTLAIKSLVVDGESLFQAILGIREAIDAEVQENTRPKRGRPSILISEHQLLFLLEHGFTVAQMAAFFGCSQRTVERRMQEHGIRVREVYSAISNDQLADLICSMLRQNPNLGEKSVDGLLRAQGHIVQRQRIRDTIWAVDPEGVQARLRRCLHCREYQVEAPNALWHIDGYHKLIRWKIVIHGGIDGYSRLVVFLKAATNNRSETALSAFLQGVAAYGLPSRMRTDRGGENVLIGQYMIQHRGTDRG